MSSVIDKIERDQLKAGLPSFGPGDRVRVHFQVIEGNRKRTQVFEGVVLRRQGSGVRETFTVRKQSFGVGVERTFPLHSPKIEKLEVAARGDVRRAKLYYLRGRIGKAARVAERRWGIDEDMVSTPAGAESEAVDAEGVTQTEAEVAEGAAPVDEEDGTDQAAGPVVEDDSSSSQAAGEEPSSTPPAADASGLDAAEPAAKAAEAEEPEASEEGAPEAETEAAAADTDAEAPAAGETEDSPASEDAEGEAPAEAGDSDEGSS